VFRGGSVNILYCRIKTTNDRIVTIVRSIVGGVILSLSYPSRDFRSQCFVAQPLETVLVGQVVLQAPLHDGQQLLDLLLECQSVWIRDAFAQDPQYASW